MKKKATVIVSLALAGSLYANVTLLQSGKDEVITPVEAPHYVDKQAVINALSTKAQIVGLTGKVSKTIEFHDDQWYGDKTYKLAATGTFKLGVQTSDIIVTTNGNTVTVKFPQPKIISVEMPFDKAKISKDVGVFRKDLNEAQIQSMYGKARIDATEEIKRNRQAFDKANESVERMIEALIKPVDYVEKIEFVGAK